jgi:hypothetical protein
MVPDVVTPYPDEEDDIISTWEQRREELAIDSIQIRWESCQFDDYPPVHISEYSLEGTALFSE